MKQVLLLAALALLAFGVDVQRHASHRRVRVNPASRVAIESVSTPVQVAPGWRRVGAAADSAPVRVHVGLAQRNVDELERAFHAVSDPRSPAYGHYLTRDEVVARFSPLVADEERVVAWLRAGGCADFKRYAEHRDLVECTLSAADATALFAADFAEYEHVDARVRAVRALGGYTVDADIAPLVAYVAGLYTLPTLYPRGRLPVREQFDGDAAKRQSTPAIGPLDLRAQYNCTDVGDGSSATTQAVAEFQGQYFSPSDLTKFFAQYAANFSAYDTVAAVRGDQNNPNAPGVEAELDIQYIMGVAPNVPTYFYVESTFDFWQGLGSWTALLAADANPPQVHSVSYGDQSAASQPSHTYKSKINQEFMKLGARGVSILFASGDSGEGCTLCIFAEPSFPATSPYVTSVGATRFLSTVPGPEGAVSRFHSGGGFSWDFVRPAYQDAAVTEFLKAAHQPFKFTFNSKGRATPDVAALGIGFQVVVDGATQLIGGTSASAPTFSALVSLLNVAQRKAGKPALGFLNHWLYQTAAASSSAFFDVVEGSNSDGCCFVGFTCVKGYDAVDGLGTPNYKMLKSMLP